jgi:hypothetical protein
MVIDALRDDRLTDFVADDSAYVLVQAVAELLFDERTAIVRREYDVSED